MDCLELRWRHQLARETATGDFGRFRVVGRQLGHSDARPMGSAFIIASPQNRYSGSSLP